MTNPATRDGPVEVGGPADDVSDFSLGTKAPCSRCGGQMEFRGGLEYRVPDGPVVGGLTGFVCAACGRREWGPRSYDAIVAKTEASRGEPGAAR